MNAKGERFPENLKFELGHILGLDRGFMSEILLEIMNKIGLQYAATRKKASSFLFSAPEKASSGQRVVAEKGIRLAEWAVRKLGKVENYAVALREEGGSSLTSMMTNFQFFGPKKICVKP